MKNIKSPIVSHCQTLHPQQVEKPLCAVGAFIMEEIWKDIQDFEGIYQVSNLGRIRRIKINILKENGFNNGYCRITLSNKSISKNVRVNRIVAKAFLPNPENKPEVNHKNGIKTDNSVLNLEWSTSKENKEHAIKNGLMPCGEKQGSSKLTEEDVLNIRAAYKNKVSSYKLAKIYNMDATSIMNIIKRKSWKHI